MRCYAMRYSRPPFPFHSNGQRLVPELCRESPKDFINLDSLGIRPHISLTQIKSRRQLVDSSHYSSAQFRHYTSYVELTEINQGKITDHHIYLCF